MIDATQNRAFLKIADLGALEAPPLRWRLVPLGEEAATAEPDVSEKRLAATTEVCQ